MLDQHRREQSDDIDESQHAVRTRLIHGRTHTRKWEYSHHVVPPQSCSATFRLDSVARGAQGFDTFAHDRGVETERGPTYIYDRLDEPTRAMLEENLATAEGGEMALCFASGMGAISATMLTLLQAGEHVVAHRVLYGCTYSLVAHWLPRLHIDHTLVDLADPDNIRDAVTPRTRVVYFETPVNPDLLLIDIKAVRRVVDELNAKRGADDRIHIVVDNTFASPICQRPLGLGADIVCCSLTKSIGGFGTDVGGAVIGPRRLHDSLILCRKDFGGSLSPRSAWPTLVYGLPSLASRMANYQSTALHVARYLSGHPKVERVHYPGLESFPQYELARRQMFDDHGNFAPGSIVYFVVRDEAGDGLPAARMMDWIAANAYCITLAVSLGQIKTLIECPYNMTHAAMPDDEKRAEGVVPGGCRISIGLEDRNDLIRDLDRALEVV